MKKALSLILILILIFTLNACTGKENNHESLAVCLASEPDSIDPALNSTSDGSTMLAHLFSGLAKWNQDENGKLVIAPDAAEELTEGKINSDGTVTYTYKLREGLKWSDGQDVVAEDFVYAWNRAASPELSGDYNYMFDVIVGYDEMWKVNSDGNYANADAELSAEALDKRTLQVTLKSDVTYWNELLAFPTFYPVRKDVVSDDAWSTQPGTYISNGAYKLTSWEHNSVITLTKNNNYYAADSVTMPEIRFYLSDNSNNMLTNFRNGDWLLIDDIPSNEFASLKEEYADEFSITEQLGTYYICWNINENLLPEKFSGESDSFKEKASAEIRKAISLLIDRNYIVNNITLGNETPASTFIPKGLSDFDGTEFYLSSGDGENYNGYYDVREKAFEENYENAIEILKKYYTFDDSTGQFTDIPVISYIYNKSDNHQAIGEYIQGALSTIGISVELINQEWNTFLNTRKGGEYTIARNGWIADYNYPLTFLDMWTTASGNNDIQFGKGEHSKTSVYSLDLTKFGIDYKVDNGTWAETYDVLIKEIKDSSNKQLRYNLMHLAEDMLMETGCIMPIYYYTDVFMVNNKLKGFFTNPLGYKYFMHTTIEEQE